MEESAKLKVWIVNHYALPPDEPGSSRHYALAKQLVKHGHEVFIFAANIHYNNYRQLREVAPKENYLAEEIEPGLHFVWIRTTPYTSNNWRRYLNIVSFVRRLKLNQKEKKFGTPDVIIGSSFHLFSPWMAMKYARKAKIPFITEIRDLWPETLIQLGAKKWNPLVLLLSYMEKRIYRESNHIILLFPYAYKYILQLNIGIKREKMSWIPNGVNVELFANAKVPDAPKFKRIGRFSILNAGSLGNVYVLEYLIEAAHLLTKKGLAVDIHFVGDGPKKESLKNYASELNLENVFFHDPVGKDQMPELLQEFDLLYASLMDSPLYKWGMSLNKIHEYLAAGKPIVFAVNAVNNPVKEAGAGITVKSNNSIQIAESIEAIMQLSPKEIDRLGSNGISYAKENFDFLKLGTQLNDIIYSSLK
jgi:glycosyltransferase involved in cell wall biosynthesis